MKKDSLKFNFTTHLNSFKLQAQSEFQNGINALWGKSGSGKTTFFNSLSGFLNTIEGEIIFNDKKFFFSEEKLNLSPENRNLAYVQQQNMLFNNMNVIENIEFGYKFSKQIVRQITPSDAISLFDLKEYELSSINQLSGGQLQRVALARAFASNSPLMLLDEPLNALDLGSRKTIMQTINDLNKSLENMIIMVTHSPLEVLNYADTILYVDNGKAEKKLSKSNLLNYLSDEEVINEIHQKSSKFYGNFFSSKNVILVRNSFDQISEGFDFSGNIKSIIKNDNNYLIEISSENKYFVNISIDLLSNLNLSLEDKIYCFVYENLILE